MSFPNHRLVGTILCDISIKLPKTNYNHKPMQNKTTQKKAKQNKNQKTKTKKGLCLGDGLFHFVFIMLLALNFNLNNCFYSLKELRTALSKEGELVR